MIKELFTLAKMLFQSKPSDMLGKDLELMFMEHIPFKSFGYMSWCGKVIVRKEYENVVHEYYNERIKRHEYGHVMQAIYHGDNWLEYYLSYSWNWLKHCPWIHPSSAVYFFNKYECECYANDERPKYWKDYDIDNLITKYSIRKPRKIWRELGGDVEAWKAYVRTL